MGTTPKRLKCFDESKTLELEDRISNLPESLIGHILSFLPTKFAVGTSALSTIWKKQWTLIPNLDFSNLPESLIGHILSFLPTKFAVGTSALSTIWKKQWTLIPNLDFEDTVLMKSHYWCDIRVQTSFISFVYRVLALHNRPHIRHFRLKCVRLNYVSHINSWISVALSRNVRKLDLFFCVEISPLPSELFTSRTLAELRVESVIDLNIPALVFLPSLRAIHLHFIRFKDEESLNRFISSCPVLEDLAVVYCNWCNICILSISCATLKKLTIESGYGDYSIPHKIQLDMPRLLDLSYAGHLAEDFALKGMEFLVKARVHIPYYGVAKEAIEVIAQGISNVKALHLSGNFLETCKLSRLDFPPFCNLRTLVVGYNRNGSWKILPQLLESSPNLKFLKLNDGPYDKEWLGRFKWVPPKIVPTCLLLHLEEILFHAFEGDAEEMKMMNYLLINAGALKKFTVKSAMDTQKELEVRQKLLTFSRGSLHCEVVVS